MCITPVLSEVNEADRSRSSSRKARPARRRRIRGLAYRLQIRNCSSIHSIPGAFAFVTIGPSMMMCLGMSRLACRDARAAAAPATIAPPWITARGIAHRGVHAAFDHGLDRGWHCVDATDQDFSPPSRFHNAGGGERHIVVVEERSVDPRERVEVGFPKLCGLRKRPNQPARSKAPRHRDSLR